MTNSRLSFFLMLFVVTAGQAQESAQILQFERVSSARINKHVRELSKFLERRSLAHKGTVGMGMVSNAYNVCLPLYFLYCFYNQIDMTLPGSSLSLPASFFSVDGLKFVGQLVGLSALSGMAGIATQIMLDPFKDAQSLAWYVYKQNPYFVCIHTIQQNALQLERAAASSIESQEYLDAKNTLMTTSNQCIDSTERLIAYMICSSKNFSKKKLAQAITLREQLKKATDEWVDTIQKAYEKHSYVFIMSAVQTLYQRVSVILASFTIAEGTAPAWCDALKLENAGMIHLLLSQQNSLVM